MVKVRFARTKIYTLITMHSDKEGLFLFFSNEKKDLITKIYTKNI